MLLRINHKIEPLLTSGCSFFAVRLNGRYFIKIVSQKGDVFDQFMVRQEKRFSQPPPPPIALKRIKQACSSLLVLPFEREESRATEFADSGLV